MTRTLRAALRLLHLSLLGCLASNEWQYFCFSPATPIGMLSKKIHFSMLPATTEPAHPPPPAPPPAAEVEEAAPPDDARDGTEAEPAAEDPMLATIQRLEATRGSCYFMRVGYWTYEVCPFGAVRQYHSETGAAGAKSSQGEHHEFSLGVYKDGQSSWQDPPGVFVQTFSGGTEGRRSTVWFVCPDSWRDEDGIVSVTEPAAKQYEITLRLASACPPAAKPAKAATKRRKMVRAGVSNKGPPSKAAAVRTDEKAAASAASAATPAQSVASPTAATPVSSRSSGPPQIAEIMLPNTRLLASIRGRCFSMVRDYWTYEICPMQHVRQFRQNGNSVGAQFSLGEYDKAQDKVTVGVRGDFSQKSFVPHMYTQTYNHGTADRKTQVRVRCSTKNEHQLIAVEEPVTHSYVFLFSSPLACELSCAYAWAASPKE